MLWHSKQSSPLVALDHAGREVWEYDLGAYTHGQGGATSPIVVDDQRSLVSPIIAGDLVIAGSGAAGGTRHVVAVKPHQTDTRVAASEAYHVTRQAPHIPTPIAYRDWLFLWSDQGIVTCLD